MITVSSGPRDLSTLQRAMALELFLTIIPERAVALEFFLGMITEISGPGVLPDYDSRGSKMFRLYAYR